MSVEDYREEIELLGKMDFTTQSGTLGDDIANVLNEGVEDFELSSELTILFNEWWLHEEFESWIEFVKWLWKKIIEFLEWLFS